MPLICCPLNIDYTKDILNQLEIYKNTDYDLLEIRLDYFDDLSFDNIKQTINLIKSYITKPLVVTLRTFNDGGNYMDDNYFDILEFIIDNRLADYLDVELLQLNDELNTLLFKAQNYSIEIILSYHQFKGNFSKDSLLAIYYKMSNYHFSFKKIAVLAKNNDDVVSFVKFSDEVKLNNENKCLILMGELGCFSRFDLTYTNNHLLYASIEKNNAPGQITLKQLKQLIKK